MAVNGSRNKVTLWTRQDIKSLEELKKEGVIRITQKHLDEKFDIIADYIIKLYQWFVQAANRRVPKPDTVEFPIWCSVSEENMLRPTEDTVVYVLEADESEVIYFDSIKWDYVLNHLYIPKDAEDDAAYRAEMRRRGHKDVFSFIDGKTAHFYPLEKKQVMDSWVRIFDIDEWNAFRVQANIWEIRPEMIKEIIHYNEDDRSTVQF
jgi:hypothetical protein